MATDAGHSDDWFESVGTSQGEPSTLSITMVLYSFFTTGSGSFLSIKRPLLAGFYYMTLLMFSFCCFPCINTTREFECVRDWSSRLTLCMVDCFSCLSRSGTPTAKSDMFESRF